MLGKISWTHDCKIIFGKNFPWKKESKREGIIHPTWGGNGGWLGLNMEECQGLPFGKKMIHCPFQRILARLVLVDRHRYRIVPLLPSPLRHRRYTFSRRKKWSLQTLVNICSRYTYLTELQQNSTRYRRDKRSYSLKVFRMSRTLGCGPVVLGWSTTHRRTGARYVYLLLELFEVE